MKIFQNQKNKSSNQFVLHGQKRLNHFKAHVETTRSQQCASETRSVSSLKSLKEERYKLKMQRTLNQSLTKESGSLYIAGHQVVNLKQLDLTEECLQDDKLDSQKHFNKNFNRIKTYS